METGAIKLRDVLALIDHVYQRQSAHPGQQQMLSDITLCRDHIEEQTSDQGQLSKYIHFATSMPQIWVRFGKETGLYELIKSSTPIVCYLRPNVPVNYAWFNFSNKHLSLIKHTLPLRDHPLKVLCYYFYKAPKGEMQVEEMRMAYDMAKNEPMRTVKGGSFLNLTYRSDVDRFEVPPSGCTTYCDFVIVLTTGKHYQLQGVFHNDASTRKIHRLATLLHPIMP